MTAVLQVRDLHVTFPSEMGEVRAVRGLSFDLRAGEAMALVGESGSGKSATSLAIMGLHPPSARITGSVTLDGTELLGRSDAGLSELRGRRISMIFSDPLSALTPVYTVGDQIVETILAHHRIPRAKAWTRAVELLDLVGIPNPAERARAFPFEFSGGMRQRVMIAMAIANEPGVIIADEPTTALDVTVAAQVLEVLRKAQRETGAGLLLITHDLGIVAGMADRVTVMYAGRPVEQGPVDDIFATPRMPYTIGLLATVPRLDLPDGGALPVLQGDPASAVNLPSGCPFRPRCPLAIEECSVREPGLSPAGAGHVAACHRVDEIVAGDLGHAEIFGIPEPAAEELVRVPREARPVVLRVTDLERHYPLMKGAVYRRRIGTVTAVDRISFDIRQGETLGLVGESGCGKTTTLMEILSLQTPAGGSVEVLGRDPARLNRRQRKALRRNLQVVFADPMAALDPRMTVFDIIAEPLLAHGHPRAGTEQRVTELLRLVGLEPGHGERYPLHLSGGQQQRVGIARAVSLEPEVLLLDEPVSALDVSVQAGVVNLLRELQARLGLAYLFVAHDLTVVRHIADRVAVMYAGRIVEIGSVAKVYGRPAHPYTRALMSAIPIPDPVAERSRQRILLSGDAPSTSDPPAGCAFAGRCPRFRGLTADEQRLCRTIPPELTGQGGDHAAACHYPDPPPA